MRSTNGDKFISGALDHGAEKQPTGLLAGMRIRKKLIFLHTCFSLTLAAFLLIAIRPAITNVVTRAEMGQASRLLEALVVAPGAAYGPRAPDRVFREEAGVAIRSGDPDELGLSPAIVSAALAMPGVPVQVRASVGEAVAAVYVEEEGAGSFWTASLRIPEAREAVTLVYALLIVSLLAVYALVAIALEVFVLPRHVYGPIRSLLRADRAVQEGRRGEELIPESMMPADELGEIMRSRNDSVRALRQHERDLADALDQLETVATDLKKKNYLLETARKNLEGADRLASLGMMSAGIAHELNTPLTVAKGLVEKLQSNGTRALTPTEAALLGRVIGRLERLGDSLLDFARVRPPAWRPVDLHEVVEEAATLVRLDRDKAGSRSRGVAIENRVEPGFVVECDGDRMVQVFVNLLRNASDAVSTLPEFGDGSRGHIVIEADTTTRDGDEWACVRVSDDGPGIDPEFLPKLFEPFITTRLDARGTGLGLAVAEGIVHEHSGLILAQNRPSRAGAVFEVMLPLRANVRADNEEPSGDPHGGRDGASRAQVD